MPFPELEAIIPHLKLAAIDALMRENNFTIEEGYYKFTPDIPEDNPFYFRLIVTRPNPGGEGGGDFTVEFNRPTKDAPGDFPDDHFQVQFNAIRGNIDFFLKPFLSLPQTEELEYLDHSLHDRLVALNMDTPDDDTPSGHMAISFADMKGVMEKLSGLAVSTFRMNFLRDIELKLGNLTPIVQSAYVGIAAQHGIISATKTIILDIAETAIKLFDSVTSAGSDSFEVPTGPLVLITTTAIGAALGGLPGAIVGFAGALFNFVEEEYGVRGTIGLLGPSHAECMKSLTDSIKQCAEDLKSFETTLAVELNKLLNMMKSHPNDYRHTPISTPAGDDAGIRNHENINLPTEALTTVHTLHLPTIINYLDEAITPLRSLDLESPALRDPSLGYSTNGAMTECQDLMITCRQFLEDIREDIDDGRANLEATVKAFENNEDESALMWQEQTADAMLN